MTKRQIENRLKTLDDQYDAMDRELTFLDSETEELQDEYDAALKVVKMHKVKLAKNKEKIRALNARITQVQNKSERLEDKLLELD